MLTSVPTAVNAAARRVVLKHPNAMPCTVWRKQVSRAPMPGGAAPSMMGGMPTLGGMGVLSSEEEDRIEYVELGPASMLTLGPYQPTDMVDRDNGIVAQLGLEVRVESVAEPGEAGHFTADQHDLVAVTPGMGVVLAYEVTGVLSQANIPPYVRRLAVTPRDDLHQLAPWVE